MKRKNKSDISIIAIILIILSSISLVVHLILHQTDSNKEIQSDNDSQSDYSEYISEEIYDNFDSETSNDSLEENSFVEESSNVEENSSSETIYNSSGNFSIGEILPLPDLPTHVKTFTDYRCYNLKNTPHYRLQRVSYTDENGLRRFNNDYIVAMGAFYSTKIGDRFKVTLDTGREFTVILGDGKHPNDCDKTNMYAPCKNYNGDDCANILEFIIDKHIMKSKVYSYGSIDCIPEFKGNIIKLEYLGRDNSADWTSYNLI